MHFEKLNENKIRIILNNNDLKNNNIDLNFFMSNPLESQKIFFVILNTLEKNFGFITKNYNLKIDRIKFSTDNFILTITRSIPIKEKIEPNKRYTKQNKKVFLNHINNNGLVYCFDSFDDFLRFH